MVTRRSRPAPDGHVLALFGPTASGKTAVAAALAERLDMEVVSADSAALYEGLRVLTAAPPPPARLVGVVPVEREISVAEYQRLAHDAIDEVLARRDPAAARRVHPNDRRRVVRALELWEMGHSLAPADDRLWTKDTRHPTRIFALDLPLPELDRRIETRTREMVAGGAVEEAKAAWALRLSATAEKVLGLQEFATLPVPQAVEEVARATKRLARYQLKWLRKLPNVVTLAADRPVEEIADDIVSLDRAGEYLPRRRRG